jgi:hypothetical protein
MQTMPQGSDPNRNLQLIGTALLQLDQRQVGLGFNPAMEGPIMPSQPGTPIAAYFFREELSSAAVLLPEPLDAFAADPKPFADFACAFASLTRGNDSLPQILTQWTHR